MAISQVTAKIVLTIINVLFCVLAVILVMMGSWLFSHYYDYDHVASDNSTLIPACIVTAVGVFLLLVGILGFVVTFKVSKCLTGLFLFLLIALLVALIVGAVLAYVYRKDIDVHFNSEMKLALDEYASDKYVQKEVDFMQTELKCCGVDNYTDWLETPWYKNQTNPKIEYPASCCQSKNCTYERPDGNLYEEGCYDKLKHEFINHLTVIASVAAACAIVLLLGILFSAVLLCRRSSDVGYIGLPESDGLQV